MDSEYDDGDNNSSGAPSDGSSEQEDSSQTALLPRSFFGDKDVEVGKVCRVKIEAIHSEEIEVSYIPHKSNEEPKMSEATPATEDDSYA